MLYMKILEAAYYNENDPFAYQWLLNLIEHNLIAPGDVDGRSIEDVPPADVAPYRQAHFFAGIGVWSHALQHAGYQPRSAKERVWTMSCPCQPFSAAGKGAGFADERHLWPAAYWLIQQCRPELLFGEQVAHGGGVPWLDLVHADLEAIQYTCGAVNLPACGFGAPHIRQRAWWVAYAGDAADNVAHAEREQRRSRGKCYRSDEDGEKVWNFHRENFNPRSDAGSLEHSKRGRRFGRQTSPSADYHAGPTSEREKGDHGSGEPDTHWPAPTPADALNGYWQSPDWLLCTDGKYRPVRSGTQPLANGVAQRVGRLRAYGNAIVGPVAAEFIKAALEVVP